MRDNVAFDQTPIQQSMTLDSTDYAGVTRLDRLMLGVVLEVYPSDQEEGNRSSRQTLERRGHTHECTVLIVNDGTSTYLTLPHVIITPNSSSGLDNYEEQLPRGSSKVITGVEKNSSLHQIDPYDLDGDWCVVGFLGGQLDSPFILRWWPHARNTFDPATSGEGNATTSGGRALEQAGRYFRRINGVETVVTSIGDVVVSTTFTGGEIQPGQDSVRGRFARTETERGGNVRIYMKPASTLEWTWNPQEDGIGPIDEVIDELPQPNPPQGNRAASDTRSNTYIQVTDISWEIQVPTSARVVSQDTVTISAVNTTSISGDTSVSIASENGSIELDATTMIDLIAPAITFGEDGVDFLVKGTSLNVAWQAVLTALNIPPDATDPATTQVLANANRTAIRAMISALTAALSTTTKTL
jgi:hypothetical protein